MDYKQEIIYTLERILCAAEESSHPNRHSRIDPAKAAILHIDQTERSLDKIFHLAEDALNELREEGREVEDK